MEHGRNTGLAARLWRHPKAMALHITSSMGKSSQDAKTKRTSLRPTIWCVPQPISLITSLYLVLESRASLHSGRSKLDVASGSWTSARATRAAP